MYHADELFKRYKLIQLPIAPWDDRYPTCQHWCDAVWNAIDAKEGLGISQVRAEWRKEFKGETDQAERSELQKRFALMARNTQTGWCYGVKTPPCPRVTLWISIEKRLTALGISAEVRKVFHTLGEMARVLAGSGILVQPPPLQYGVDARDYVFGVLEPAFTEPELRYCNLQWETFALRRSSGFMSREDFHAAKASMITNARTNNGEVWGPDKEDFTRQWEDFRSKLVAEDSSPILAGQLRDLVKRAEDFGNMFGYFVKPHGLFITSRSKARVLGSLSIEARRRMRDMADKACREFRDTVVADQDQNAFNAQVRLMKRSVAAGGDYFAPWQPPPTTAIGPNKDPLSRGSGTDRSGLQGTWRWKGRVGEGGQGQISAWEQVDANDDVIDRLVLKETYVGTLWNLPHIWHGDLLLRRPREYFFANYLASLPGSSCIVKPKAYAIYENVRMYRLYMEYCRHESLAELMSGYLTPLARAANE